MKERKFFLRVFMTLRNSLAVRWSLPTKSTSVTNARSPSLMMKVTTERPNSSLVSIL